MMTRETLCKKNCGNRMNGILAGAVLSVKYMALRANTSDGVVELAEGKVL